MADTNVNILIQSLIESSRCLGVYQQKEDAEAIRFWQKKVDECSSELKKYYDDIQSK